MTQDNYADNWLYANARLWDARVPLHLNSAWYDLSSFKRGELALDDIELAGVGDVRGQRLLHLQCHFGLGTLSWARLGAKATGVDFSAEAVREGQRLAAEEQLDCNFVCADVTRLDLNETFDIITTSWGVLCWLPELDGWARGIAAHLRAGGRFFLAETHPVAWIWQDDPGTTTFHPKYPYFQDGAPLEAVVDTYADPTAKLEMPEYTWNHPLASVVTALATAGLHITELKEYPQAPWRALPWMERDDASGWWRLPSNPLPLSFSLSATKA